MSDVKDFDAAWKEKDDEGYPFKVKGEKYELPSSPPAGIVLEALRLGEEFDEDDAVPNDRVFNMAQELIGKENLQQMLDDGISIDELRDIVEWANEVYAPSEADSGDGSGNSTSSGNGGQ